jgi:hypothetical protein
MKHNEKKMVDAIMNDTPSEFVDAFKNNMNDRISQKIDNEKIQVAKEIIVEPKTEE